MSYTCTCTCVPHMNNHSCLTLMFVYLVSTQFFTIVLLWYIYVMQVRQKITEMVKRLQREIPGIRIAIIGHGDYCDGPNILTIMDFSNDEKQLCEFVKNIPATGIITRHNLKHDIQR